jgi:hypothetical protein
MGLRTNEVDPSAISRGRQRAAGIVQARILKIRAGCETGSGDDMKE